MTREEAYQENPEMAVMTDFLFQHEKQLKVLYKKYKKDTNYTQCPFIGFVFMIYNEAQDLVLNPSNN